MQRHYLTEDVRLIQKYFPGAKPVAMCTPFDLTNRPLRLRPTEVLHDDMPEDGRWYGDIIWNR